MKQKQLIYVANEDAGKRLDLYLVSQFPDESRSFIQDLIGDGQILLNNSMPKQKVTVKGGDCIQVSWPDKSSIALLPNAEISLTVLYEDQDVLVMDKPANLVVHPGSGTNDKTLVHALLNYDYDTFSRMVDEECRPGIVHRLDKDTTGVMVIAKSEAAREQLVQAFKHHRTRKIYIALVHGMPERKEGTIESLIGRSPANRKKMAVVNRNGKPAVSTYSTIASGPDFSLLKIAIDTGRTHQIRVHLSYIHHPIAGDSLYNGRRQAKASFPRQMLHAFVLEFPHPTTDVMQQFQARIPDDFLAAANQVGIQVPDSFRETLCELEKRSDQ